MKRLIFYVVTYAVGAVLLLPFLVVLLPTLALFWMVARLSRLYRRWKLYAVYDGDEALREKEEWMER